MGTETVAVRVADRVATVAIFSILSFLTLLPAIGAQAPADKLEYELFIGCPQREDFVGQAGGPCPIKAMDEADIMGSPSIAVDPDDPDNMIIGSLHGMNGDGPTDRSRQGQVFTTFTSQDAGGSWWDNPYVPPARMNGAFGEHPQATIDAYGHVYIGSLYSEPSGREGRWTYTLVVQKFESLQRTNREQDGSANGEFLSPVYEGNTIDQFWFIYDRETDYTTIVWGERVPETSQKTDSLLPDLPTTKIQVAQENETTGQARSVIGVAWSTPEVEEPWTYIPEPYNVGPCQGTSNPVLADGMIYVACVVDADGGPYQWDSTVKDGQVDVFRFLPTRGKPQYMGTSPITGDAPKLGVRSDGRLALVSSETSKAGTAKLTAAFGTVNPSGTSIDWTPAQEYNGVFSKPRPGVRTVSTSIQDLIYREQSGVVHLILKQQYERTGANLDDALATLSGPYGKQLIAIDERHGLVKEFNLDVGNVVNRTYFETTDDTVFNDLSDDFLQLPPGDFKVGERELGPGYEREFFVVGDYGIVKFAEVIEITNLRAPGAPQPQPPPPPAPAPAANAAAQIAVAGTTSGAISGIIALRLFTNKRKSVVGS